MTKTVIKIKFANQAHELSCGYALLTSCTNPLGFIEINEKFNKSITNNACLSIL
ncbi:hypothetical protein POKO110462_22450 [Pontibacter korlensis]